MKSAGHVTHMEVMRNACNMFSRPPERERAVRRPSVDLSIILKRIVEGCVDVDWIYLAQSRVYGRDFMAKVVNFMELFGQLRKNHFPNMELGN